MEFKGIVLSLILVLSMVNHLRLSGTIRYHPTDMVIIFGVPMPISQALQDVVSRIVAKRCILVGGFNLVISQERQNNQNLFPPSPVKKVSSKILFYPIF